MDDTPHARTGTLDERHAWGACHPGEQDQRLLADYGVGVGVGVESETVKLATSIRV